MALDSGAGVVLVSPDGSRLRYAIHLHFLASNNTAEYEALINGLCIAIELGATRLYVHGDSELVVDQVMKESSCKSPPHGSILLGGVQARGQILGDRTTSCPPKGQRCCRFSHKIGYQADSISTWGLHQ